MTERLPLTEIFPNPNQPRKEFDEAKLNELAQSIREYGVMEPIVVTPRQGRFMIVGGERRYRASLLAGSSDIPVHMIEADDGLVEEMALLENVQREDLNDMEEARAFRSLIDKGMSKEELSGKIGKQVRHIDMRLSLLNLRPEYQEMTAKGRFNHNESYEMSRLYPEEQEVAYRKIATGELLSFNKLREFIDGIIARRNQEAIFALTAINEAERHTINDLESVLRSVERFITSIDKEREAHLKKVAFHSSVTPETLDLVIQKLMKLRKLIHAGYGIKSAAEAA